MLNSSEHEISTAHKNSQCCKIKIVLAFKLLDVLFIMLINVNMSIIVGNIYEHDKLSTALAKNHAKPAKGDTSHVTKMNIFRFSQLIMS